MAQALQGIRRWPEEYLPTILIVVVSIVLLLIFHKIEAEKKNHA